jgi:Sortase domain
VSRRRPLLPAAAVLAALALIAAGAAVRGSHAAAPVQPAREAGADPVLLPRSTAPKRRAHRAALPVRLEIPAIGVRAPLVRLGLDASGALEVPSDFGTAGWWSGGARPGEPGPAVIAAHVDSRTGPALFFRLGELRRGDLATIVRADGSRARFAVERSARYPKARFPTALVYGRTRRPALRLITCSGAFDRASGHYRDNTVVFARG